MSYQNFIDDLSRLRECVLVSSRPISKSEWDAMDFIEQEKIHSTLKILLRIQNGRI
jgi:hypothetical protein